jgi:peptidoglycan L-alanyl-D-glutamate endopeptidase CwlK
MTPMAFHFSKKSLYELHTCDVHLQELMFTALKLTPMDFTILQGYRSIEEQKRLFAEGKTQIDGVTKLSNHNYTPSRAVDIAPWPIDWNDRERFYCLGGLILGVAGSRGLRIRWGANWKMDGDFANNKFDDLPHFELVKNAQI